MQDDITLALYELQTQLRMLQQIQMPVAQTLIQQVQARIEYLHGQGHHRGSRQRQTRPGRNPSTDRPAHQAARTHDHETNEITRNA